MSDLHRPTPRDPRRLLFEILVAPLLWAIPFALFFGTLYGSSLESYRAAYEVSALFAFVIRGAMGLAEHLIMPRLRKRSDGTSMPWWYGAAVYSAVSVSGSYLAAFIGDRTFMPGLLGSPRAVVVSGLFALLFTLLVGGLIYARVFYRQSVSRAVDLERMKGELTRAELRALRAQVNPHFLFNTLNTIAALIHENPRAAEDVTTRLADVFRHALSASAREHTKLREELEFLQSWLEIERVRFGPRLRVQTSVEPGLGDTLVPGLLFQPLVENAVRYAVATREEGGTVTIHVARDTNGRTFTTTIADDGPGFVPGGRAHGNGVGLESVRERLRLGGEGHAFELDTAPGRGTRVRVTLPLTGSAA
ncbi:MAG: histidine kinase [Candidatus Eisenbacteria bacterium]|nr:histidine kinase [Candidatus Eisenbacteria bacterium]